MQTQSLFDPTQNIMDLVTKAMKRGTVRKISYGRLVYEFDFLRTIGSTTTGKPLTKLRVLVAPTEKAYTLVTTYPIESVPYVPQPTTTLITKDASGTVVVVQWDALPGS